MNINFISKFNYLLIVITFTVIVYSFITKDKDINSNNYKTQDEVKIATTQEIKELKSLLETTNIILDDKNNDLFKFLNLLSTNYVDNESDLLNLIKTSKFFDSNNNKFYQHDKYSWVFSFKNKNDPTMIYIKLKKIIGFEDEPDFEFLMVISLSEELKSKITEKLLLKKDIYNYFFI